MEKSLVRLKSITEPKVAKDNRSYYTATFQDPANPFAKTVSRNFWQQNNAAGEPVWKGANPAEVKPFIGKTIPGFISTKKVEDYEIAAANGDIRTATTYTTVILGSELEEVVFKSLGHPLLVAGEAEVEVEADQVEIA